MFEKEVCGKPSHSNVSDMTMAKQKDFGLHWNFMVKKEVCG